MAQFIVGVKYEPSKEYSQQLQRRKFWRLSDRAKEDYASSLDALGNVILPAHDRETEPRYKRRINQAIVRRYVRPIVNRYNDFVTRVEPVRQQGNAQYEQLLEDVDGSGTDIDTFIKRALRQAQIDGAHYILCDSNDSQIYLTAAEEQKAGKRGVLRSIGADAVLYKKARNGVICEAVVLMEDDAGQFLWHVTERTTQRAEVDEDFVVSSIGPEMEHGYKGCPLVALTPDVDGTCGEDSQAAPLSEGQKRICNIDSWLHEELQGATFTTPVFLGVDASQVKDVSVGPGKALCMPGTGDKTPSIGRLGADPAQAQSLRDSLAYEIREVYRTAGLSSGNPTEVAQPESGVAKAFAFNEIEARCAALADACEYAENRSVLLLSNAFWFPYPGDADYPDSFTVVDLSAELDLLLKMDMASLPPLLRNKQVGKIATSAFEMSGEDKAQMQAEIDAPPAKDAFNAANNLGA